LSKPTRSYPTLLQTRITQDMADALNAAAARHGLSVNEQARRLLAQGISRDAAHDATAAIEEIVRRVVRREIATTHDLAFRASFYAIAATSMVRSLWLNESSTWPLSVSDADSLWAEIRKDTANILRQKFDLPPDDDGEDSEV